MGDATTAHQHNVWVGEMKAIGATFLALLTGVLVVPSTPGRAQSASAEVRMAQAAPPDAPAPRVRRPTARLRVYPNYQPAPEVYPRYFPGPNAVRECNATYVQEHRPSGTVIVPRMSCYWRPG